MVRFQTGGVSRFRNASGSIPTASLRTETNIQTGRSALNIVTYDAPRIARVGLTLRR